MVTVADRPWRQPPGYYAAASGPYDSSQPDHTSEQSQYIVDAHSIDTLYESSEGGFVAEERIQHRDDPGFHVQATRRCCAFATDFGDGQQQMAPSAFKRSNNVSHASVRHAVNAAPDVGVVGLLHRWGAIGSVIAAFLEQKSLASWILLEDYIFAVVFVFIDAIWRFFFGVPTGARGHLPGHGSVSPVIAWHPHRDLLATISVGRTIGLHCIGDAFSGSTTQFLHHDGCAGFPLCLMWQPNDLRGAIAVGMSNGIVLWRRSRTEGWWCAWSTVGMPFASSAVTWSPDGRSLAAGGVRGVVRVWLHDELFSEQPAQWCITLRRWRGGPIGSIQWGPDGALLAVAHCGYGGSSLLIRLWDTRSWEITAHVDLGALDMAVTVSATSISLAWCSNETLLTSVATPTGRLVELCGLGTGGGGWAAGSEPLSRALPLPQLRVMRPSAGDYPRSPGSPTGKIDRDDEYMGDRDGAGGRGMPASTMDAAGPSLVAEVAVCPRTAQRIAVRLHGASHVLVFERLFTGEWAKQELVLRGLVSAKSRFSGSPPLPRALSFAGGPAAVAHRHGRGQQQQQQQGHGGGVVEGSFLAVYWDFGEYCEVRTYPMYYLPYRLMQCDMSVLFD